MRRLLASLVAAALLFAPTAAVAGSTINPAQPAANSPLASGPVRANFASAYNDINNLLSKYNGPSAPGSPSLFQWWIDTSTSPAIFKIYDGSTWISWATIDQSGHAFAITGIKLSGTITFTGGTLVGGTLQPSTPLAVAYGGTGASTAGVSASNNIGALAIANNLGDPGFSASAARANLGLAAVASSGSAGDLSTGTLLCARMPALTGDVTLSAGTCSDTLAHGNAGNLDSGTLLPARLPVLGGGFVSGRYYMGQPGSASTLALTANTIYAVPFKVLSNQTFTKQGLEVTANAGTNCRAGVYASANGVPTTLVVDSGNFSSGSNAIVENTGLTIGLTPGLYFQVVVCDNTPTLRASTPFPELAGLLGATADTTSPQETFLSAAQTEGALPGTWPGGGNTYISGPAPILWMRY